MLGNMANVIATVEELDVGGCNALASAHFQDELGNQWRALAHDLEDGVWISTFVPLLGAGAVSCIRIGCGILQRLTKLQEHHIHNSDIWINDTE